MDCIWRTKEIFSCVMEGSQWLRKELNHEVVYLDSVSVRLALHFHLPWLELSSTIYFFKDLFI